MGITIFSIKLFDEKIDENSIIVKSWKDNIPGCSIKIYTEQDDIVKEALNKAKDLVDFCINDFNKYIEPVKNFVKLYILSKYPSYLYIDATTVLLKNLNIDLNIQYINFDSNQNGDLNIIYNGNKTLDAYKVMDYMINMVDYYKKLYISCTNECKTHNYKEIFLNKKLNDNCISTLLMRYNDLHIFDEQLSLDLHNINLIFNCEKYSIIQNYLPNSIDITNNIIGLSKDNQVLININSNVGNIANIYYPDITNRIIDYSIIYNTGLLSIPIINNMEYTKQVLDYLFNNIDTLEL